MKAKDVCFSTSREYPCTPDTLWECWAEKEMFELWWGPKECSLELLRFEFRPGGIIHYAMHLPDTVMWGRFVLLELLPGEKLVWLNSFSNSAGGIIRSPFSEDLSLELLNTVHFVEKPGNTVLELSAQPVGEQANELAFFKDLHPSLATGFTGTFDRLAIVLEKILCNC